MEAPKIEAAPELPPEVVPTIPRAVPKAEKPKPKEIAPAAPEKKIEAPASQPEEEKEEPAMDFSGIGVGSTVKHKKFGEGVVTKRGIVNGKIRIDVSFGAGEKTFEIPSAFENGFLTI